jgi:hypothetical protein
MNFKNDFQICRRKLGLILENKVFQIEVTQKMSTKNHPLIDIFNKKSHKDSEDFCH